MSARESSTREINARGPRLQGPQLWCVDLAAAGAALREIERCTPRLSDADRERARAFSDAAVADEWRATHIALRLLLERAVGAHWRGVALARSGGGKPHLARAPVTFSLSHAPGLALIGLTSEGAIGVDIERSRNVRIDAARRARIEQAGAALAVGAVLPSTAEARFLQAWVRLEALAKAEGCGIGRVLTRLGIVKSRQGDEIVRGEAIAALRDVAQVHDLAMGEGVFAAAAFAGGPATADVSWLPATRAGLEKLLG